MDVFKTLLGRLVPSGILGGFLVMSLGALVANIPLWVSQYLRINALQQLGTGAYGEVAQGKDVYKRQAWGCPPAHRPGRPARGR